MNRFAKLMETINKKLVQQFERNLSSIQKDRLSTKIYILLFISTFVRMYEECFDKEDNDARNVCKQLIRNTSLCEPEYVFFEKIVDFWSEKKMDQNDLNEIEKIYNETEDLSDCQLGQPIYDCLMASKNYVC